MADHKGMTLPLQVRFVRCYCRAWCCGRTWEVLMASTKSWLKTLCWEHAREADRG